MDHIPVSKIGNYILVSIQVDVDDRVVINLQDHLTAQIVKHHSHGVLIDISALDMVDSFIGRMLSNISSMSHLLGAETVVIGMQPAVAITIMELGMDLKNIHTALNLEKGMELLNIKALGDSNANSQE